MSHQSPQWSSVSPLPLLATMIDGMLESAQENHLNLKAASHRPHLLDIYTITRMIRTYTEQQEDLSRYEEQLSYWRNEELNPDQHYEVQRLTSQVGRLCKTLNALLTLAGQIKAGTNELTLGRDDAELAMNLPSGKY